VKDVLQAAAATLAAFVLYSLLGKAGPALILIVNTFTLVVVFFAMLKGEVFGALLGTACGLLQDSFSLGVFGVAGLSKTLMGFAAGYASTKMNVASPSRSFIFIFVMATGEMALWAFLYGLVFSERIATGNALIFFQPLATAALGTGLFALVRRIRAAKARG
jgi:rod shape-determining protein MreD